MKTRASNSPPPPLSLCLLIPSVCSTGGSCTPGLATPTQPTTVCECAVRKLTSRDLRRCPVTPKDTGSHRALCQHGIRTQYALPCFSNCAATLGWYLLYTRIKPSTKLSHATTPELRNGRSHVWHCGGCRAKRRPSWSPSSERLERKKAAGRGRRGEGGGERPVAASSHWQRSVVFNPNNGSICWSDTVQTLWRHRRRSSQASQGSHRARDAAGTGATV